MTSPVFNPSCGFLAANLKKLVRAAVLYPPVQEGSHSLIDLESWVAAF